MYGVTKDFARAFHLHRSDAPAERRSHKRTAVRNVRRAGKRLHKIVEADYELPNAFRHRTAVLTARDVT
jgi:hypothetical protein